MQHFPADKEVMSNNNNNTVLINSNVYSTETMDKDRSSDSDVSEDVKQMMCKKLRYNSLELHDCMNTVTMFDISILKSLVFPTICLAPSSHYNQTIKIALF